MTSKLRRSLFIIAWFFLARWNPKGTLFLWRSFILKFFLSFRIILIIFFPIEPVDPKIIIFFFIINLVKKINNTTGK